MDYALSIRWQTENHDSYATYQSFLSNCLWAAPTFTSSAWVTLVRYCVISFRHDTTYIMLRHLTCHPAQQKAMYDGLAYQTFKSHRSPSHQISWLMSIADLCSLTYSIYTTEATRQHVQYFTRPGVSTHSLISLVFLHKLRHENLEWPSRLHFCFCLHFHAT